MPTKPETDRLPTRGPTRSSTSTTSSVHFELRGGALSRLFGRDTGTVKAVDGVNLDAAAAARCSGLVGESGSGKSTLGRALLGLVPATHGSITYHRRPWRATRLRDARRRAARAPAPTLQMVFQDPNAALNPSMTIEEAVGRPAADPQASPSGEELRTRVVAALERVGLVAGRAVPDQVPLATCPAARSSAP